MVEGIWIAGLPEDLKVRFHSLRHSRYIHLQEQGQHKSLGLINPSALRILARQWLIFMSCFSLLAPRR